MSGYTTTDPVDPTIVVNRHTRVTHGPFARAAVLLEALGGPEDQIWPADRWVPITLDRGLAVGSRGGHGSVRYAVETAVPGRSVTFRFAPDFPMRGTHRFDVEPLADDRVRWTHTVKVAGPLSMVSRLILVLHDALLEDLLDQAEAVMDGRRVVRRRRRDVGRRVASWVDDVVERRAEPLAVRRRRRPTARVTAGVLAGAGVLHAVWATGSSWPARDRNHLARAVVGVDRVPGPVPCLAVTAALLGTAAATLARTADGADDGPLPFGLVDELVRGASVVLALRAVYGVVTSGLDVVQTLAPYRRLDLTVYSPLCAALAIGLRAVRQPAPGPEASSSTRP